MDGIKGISTLDALKAKQDVQKGDVASGEFAKILEKSISEVNETQVQADKAMADIATGEVKNLHQAALAIGKAETHMKVMLEIRNKAINAFKEISKTQI